MPKTPKYMQEPLTLYPVVEKLDSAKGVETTLEDLPFIDVHHKITLGRLAMLHGNLMGPMENASDQEDSLLQVNSSDFERAHPKQIEKGLYIYPDDPRYNDPLTEQLVKVGLWQMNGHVPGVVVPSKMYSVIPHHPGALARRSMAKTRRYNKDNPDKVEVEQKVGRTPIHELEEGYIPRLDSWDKDLLEVRNEILKPLYKDVAKPPGREWQAHFKPRNLDRKRRQFDEIIHDVIETASLNLDVTLHQRKAMQRADISRRYRRGSVRELNTAWEAGILLVGNYFKMQRQVIQIARDEAKQHVTAFEAFRPASPPAPAAA